ncbi:uncharacterized protein LOC134228548 [Saccostrea cucullata]|uniref:uncharacterized protein LOC134228548 n=1 Tax=Saccostrea cuccullata TaxID=36930 RepID=UPI002ED49054
MTEFIKTEDWKPLSKHSSHINGDLLVGMDKGSEAKVTRYNKTGKELQNIQSDDKGQELYGILHYITENMNGDICTSNISRSVVVVNKSGQHRFSYTGQKLVFHPYGICTDVVGHILVCDGVSQQRVEFPRSVCVDCENNLCLEQLTTNILTVYKYLQ